MHLKVVPADPEPGVKVIITRSFLPHPTIRFMDAEETKNWGGEYAYYDSMNNELILTPNLTEDVAVQYLIHEITHWAEYMALSEDERAWEAEIYKRILRDHNVTWMANRHICENLAYWMEMDL
jgi:hypothetical protein